MLLLVGVTPPIPSTQGQLKDELGGEGVELGVYCPFLGGFLAFRTPQACLGPGCQAGGWGRESQRTFPVWQTVPA